jgi:hypothetical protein
MSWESDMDDLREATEQTKHSRRLERVVMPLRFSERMQIAIAAVEWCKQRKAPLVAMNIITAVQALGLMQRTMEVSRYRE